MDEGKVNEVVMTLSLALDSKINKYKSLLKEYKEVENFFLHLDRTKATTLEQALEIEKMSLKMSENLKQQEETTLELEEIANECKRIRYLLNR